MSTVQSMSAPSGIPPANFPDADLRAKLPVLRQIAAELFGEPVTVEAECDVEIDDDWYVVFSVVLKGNPSRAIPLELEWLRRTNTLLDPRYHLIRLSICPE
ncbi:MAG: hypothetical protein EXS05_24035 [Planctomycetaceae bacterium]|nr:hypothetical protein [Planctomycetaceae bacterium]